ncbi:MAG: hypothetical protein PHE58_02480 [Candidatus Omnitrophica bacterium]|nr:hypothetical protein [Candidatus Omnitrophota bacterium]
MKYMICILVALWIVVPPVICRAENSSRKDSPRAGGNMEIAKVVNVQSSVREGEEKVTRGGVTFVEGFREYTDRRIGELSQRIFKLENSMSELTKQIGLLRTEIAKLKPSSKQAPVYSPSGVTTSAPSVQPKDTQQSKSGW